MSYNACGDLIPISHSSVIMANPKSKRTMTLYEIFKAERLSREEEARELEALSRIVLTNQSDTSETMSMSAAQHEEEERKRKEEEEKKKQGGQHQPGQQPGSGQPGQTPGQQPGQKPGGGGSQY